MSSEIEALRRRLARYRAFVSFFLIASAQFLSPAAAADPASKIDPPAWARQHSKEEMQAYGARGSAQEFQKKLNPVYREARLRQILARQQSDGRLH